MQNLIFLASLFGIVSLLLFIRGGRKLYRRKPVSGLGLELSALLLLSISAIFLLLASNLYTYQRLVYERPVAQISFIELQPQRFRASIKPANTDDENGEQVREFEVSGDEWQLDAQVLIWKGVATLLGLDASYRLHRLSGRYRNIEKARNERHSVHSLVMARSLDIGITDVWDIDDWTLDIWEMAGKYGFGEQLVDATFGSAVFLPMADKATYDVSISRTGLVARPANTVAKEAVSRWVGW